eukprot:158465_1
MGNKNSKKRHKEKTHDICECKLFEMQSHCCNLQCFIDKQEQKQQLLTSLKVYSLQCIINFILEYLPETDGWTHDLDNGFKSLCHSQCISFYQNNKPPCSIWLKSVSTINGSMVGIHGIGKTTLLTQYFGTNDDKNDRLYKKTIHYNKQNINIHIADYFRGSDKLYLIAFEMGNKKSYDEAIAMVNIHIDFTTVIILIATKCDIALNEKNEMENNALQQARNFGIPFIETSSTKNHTNIDFLFEQILYEYWRKKQTAFLKR